MIKKLIKDKNRAGIIQLGSGINIENGIISPASATPATHENFGTVKLGNGFEINENGELELQDMNETVINSNFQMTVPQGCSWYPATQVLRDYYDGYCDCREIQFKFETFVCVDYVKYWSRFGFFICISMRISKTKNSHIKEFSVL